MLCSLCSRLETVDVRQTGLGQDSDHHKSYSALVGSAASGCELCQLFKDALLEQYCIVLGWSPSQAEDFHWARDKDTNSVFALRLTRIFLDAHESLWTRANRDERRFFLSGLCFGRSHRGTLFDKQPARVERRTSSSHDTPDSVAAGSSTRDNPITQDLAVQGDDHPVVFFSLVADQLQAAIRRVRQRCYNCLETVEVEINENSINKRCECTAEVCMICGLKWESCDCSSFIDLAEVSNAVPRYLRWSNRRSVTRRVTSVTNFNLCRLWLQNCSAAHPACFELKDVCLPTRVIDVSPINGYNNLRLLITEGLKGQYVTLSHCWGGSRPFVNNMEDLERYAQCLPFNVLPKTFQDAVTATRRLGFRYLWIDSICIVQGSVEDWQRESSKMAEIFQNSSLTIAGPAALHSNHGFLQREPRISNSVYRLHCRNADGNMDDVLLVRWERDIVQQPCLQKLEPHSLFPERGWIMQERLLSTRILYFGSRMVFWECFTLNQSEELHLPWSDDFKQNYWKRTLHNVGDQGKIGAAELYPSWDALVGAFSRTLLTNPMDKLPALSGLAQSMQRQLGDVYLAGLWQKDLLRGLKWHVPAGDFFRLGQVRCYSGDYRAPSWSWASVDCPVIYPSLHRGQSWGGPNEMRILEAGAQVSGGDRYGIVRSGSLIVAGKLQTGSISKNRITTKSNISSGNNSWAFGRRNTELTTEFFTDHGVTYVRTARYDELCTNLGEFFPDQFLDLARLNCSNETKAHSIEVKLGSDIHVLCLGRHGRRRAFALAVSKSPGGVEGSYPRYRRLGLVVGRIPLAPDQPGLEPEEPGNHLDGWFNDAKWQVVELI